jgi:hypothetical protein
MALALLLLQIANLVLAAATLWIRFRAPFLWDDQGIVFSSCAGTLTACLTALLLGIALLTDEDSKWGAALLNLVLALGFSALQGFFLFSASRDMGLLQVLKARLGGG